MKDKKNYPFIIHDDFNKIIEELNKNSEAINKEIAEAKIDVIEVQSRLLKFIIKEKAKLLIERGKLFRKIYEEESKINFNTEMPGNFSFAFRNIGTNNLNFSFNPEEIRKFNLLRTAKIKLEGYKDEARNKDSRTID